MSKKIETVYVAGAISPYPTDPPVEGYWENIKRGVYAAKELIKMGYVPYCPFIDYVFYTTPDPPDFKMGENLMKRLDLTWLALCDAILVLKKYRKSEGTKAEIAFAKERSIPVFYSPESLIEYDEMENGEE